MKLIELATLFRVINLQAHHYHNLAKGKTFFEDHVFFAELYEKADDFYDELIERHIGTVSDSIDLGKILSDSIKICSVIKGEPFEVVLKLLESSLKEIDSMCKSSSFSQGTVNLLQGQADSIEVLVYKIKRKLK